MRKYSIPEGFHISHVLPRFYRNLSVFNFDFRFSSNCKYTLGYTHDQDANKLMGLSFGFIHNTSTFWGKLFKSRANSFRIGWNCAFQNGKIQLYCYSYNNGVRKIEYICDADVNKIYNCRMDFSRTNNKVFVCINDYLDYTIDVNYGFDFSNCPRWHVLLFPYFGGKFAAPHKMTISIKQYFKKYLT